MFEIEATLVETTLLAKDSYRLTLRVNCPDFISNFVPGQFVQLSVPYRNDLLLRRPIAVESAYEGGGGLISLAVFDGGQGTHALTHLKNGEKIVLNGPLGNGFSIGDAKKIWLVAGSMGAAPLYSVIEHYDGETELFIGFSNSEYVCLVDEFDGLGIEVNLYTDDGSEGKKGNVVDGIVSRLAHEKPDLILACGPGAMLKALSQELDKLGLTSLCQTSLESRMGCGTGVCAVCNCAIKTGDSWDYKRICADGPVFNLSEVVFDEE